MEKSAPNHPGKPIHPPPLNGQCPYGINIFPKGASLTTDINTKVKNVNTVFGDRNCHPGAGLTHHVISCYEFMMIAISTVELSVETVLF